MDIFATAAGQFNLQINIKKTECLYQPLKFLSEVSLPINVSINKKLLVQCKGFNYLDSTVADNAGLDRELSLRIGHASAVYANLRRRLWNNRHVLTRVKCQVYRVLSYGAEAWTIYSVQTDRLQAYVIRHSISIMGLSWRDKISNGKVLKENRAAISGLATFKGWIRNAWRNRSCTPSFRKESGTKRGPGSDSEIQ